MESLLLLTPFSIKIKIGIYGFIILLISFHSEESPLLTKNILNRRHLHKHLNVIYKYWLKLDNRKGVLKSTTSVKPTRTVQARTFEWCYRSLPSSTYDTFNTHLNMTLKKFIPLSIFCLLGIIPQPCGYFDFWRYLSFFKWMLIFYKTLNSCKIDCKIMLESVPGTNLC